MLIFFFKFILKNIYICIYIVPSETALFELEIAHRPKKFFESFREKVFRKTVFPRPGG